MTLPRFLPECPYCNDGGGGALHRLRFRGHPGIYQICDECTTFGPVDEFSSVDHRWWPDLRTFLRDHDLTRDDIFWIDPPFYVGQVIRPRDDLEVVGVVTGLADSDGRAYDVELLDWYGRTTYAGRMKAGEFFRTTDVWERRYHERRAKAAGTRARHLPS